MNSIFTSINEGIYQLTSYASEGFLDGSHITTEDSNSSVFAKITKTINRNTKWIIIKADNNNYRLQSLTSMGYLDGRHKASDKDDTINAKIIKDRNQYTLWSIRDAGNGWYRLKSNSSDGYLDGRNTTSEDENTDIFSKIVKEESEFNKWKFVSASSSASSSSPTSNIDESTLVNDNLTTQNSESHIKAMINGFSIINVNIGTKV